MNITGAQVSLIEDQRLRTRRYLVSMAIRTVCFVLAIVFTGWLRWVFVAAAVFLPYVAVIMANAGRRHRSPARPAVIGQQQAGLGSGRRKEL